MLKLLALLGLLALTGAMKSYENYKVYNIVPKTEAQVQMLSDLQKQGYEFWTEILQVGSNVRIMVSPEQDLEFSEYNKGVGLEAVVSIPNVEELIKAQKIPAVNVARNALGSFNWDRYHSLEEIHAWLDELQDLYPNVVETIEIGNSLQGRPIKGVIIDFRRGNRADPPLIGMMEGGIHSREWISPATVTWVIREFLTSDDPSVRSMAENLIWHIFPVANPDGYVYTFTGDRMWRKNRNPANFVNCTGNDDLSNGIDLNRNFDFVWMTTGASSNPCMQTFAGPSAASELESQHISSHVLRLTQTGNMIYYFAFHSYSQMILLPYSHVSGINVLQAENYADMYEIAIRGAEKLTARYGTQYTVGTSADILYEVSGSSFDWVKGVARVPIVFLFELRDLGQYGFLLPPEQILPNNQEIMDCLIEMDATTRLLGYYTASGSAALKSVASLVISIVLLMFFK